MGLFDWLSGLFGSKGGEENRDNEDNIERDVSKNIDDLQDVHVKNEILAEQVYDDLKAQDAHETEVQKIQSEELVAAEADMQKIHVKDEVENQVCCDHSVQDVPETGVHVRSMES